jgi:sugar (pentulose or hexulose) kinase
MDYALAVIDIGMTNKKIVLYDERLRQADLRYRSFPPKIVDGLETHDLEGMEEWFIENLGELARSWPVRALAVSTHGATFTAVDREGKPVIPCVYYTHEPGEDFHRRFYGRFGGAEELQALTGTPPFKALINTAKGIFFASELYPGGLGKAAHILQYPQYWGFRFTGRAGAEGTYIGCHSYLWNQAENRLSPVAEGLGAAGRMPEKLGRSWDVLGRITGDLARRTGLSPETLVTLGIHDSNASLLPHFAKKGRRGFLLNSTGTWCVSMNPVERYGFRPGELGKVVFSNISAFGTPVKTAIFLGGQEFETWSKLLMGIHRREDLPPYDEGLYRGLLRERKSFLLPELTGGSGQFPRSRPRVVEEGRDYPFGGIASGEGVPPVFGNYERGIALLRISLALQTLTALERAGLERGSAVITEGGFRRNEAYNAITASGLPDNRVYLTDIAEAYAFGAAMTARMALTGESLEGLAGDFEVDYQEIPRRPMPELGPYREAWLSLTGE